MHVALKLFGLDVLQLDISTDAEHDELPHADTLTAEAAGFVDPLPEHEARCDVFAQAIRDGLV